jgi:hypothetical protein
MLMRFDTKSSFMATLRLPFVATVRSRSTLIDACGAVIRLNVRSLRLRLRRQSLRTFSERQLYDIGLAKWDVEPWRAEPRAEAERLFWR